MDLHSAANSTQAGHPVQLARPLKTHLFSEFQGLRFPFVYGIRWETFLRFF